jgi:hypothetical protein
LDVGRERPYEMRFEDEAVIIEKEPNELDELVLDVTSALNDFRPTSTTARRSKTVSRFV